MNYCYMTLLTADNYLPGVILLNQSLRWVKSKYPLVCLVTNELSEGSIAALKAQNILISEVDNIPTPKRIYKHNAEINPQFADMWKTTFTKFHLWRHECFDKIIYLDADLLILKNLDHCFEMPDMTAAADGEYFNLWPNNSHLNSGFFVLKPSLDTYMGLMRFINVIDPDKAKDYLGYPFIIADQDVIVAYFDNWLEDKSRHVSKYYNIFAPYILKEQERDIIDNGYFIHFTGCKPWRSTNGKPDFTYDTWLERKSKLFYEIAQGIISYVYKHDFKNIDWDNEVAGVLDEIIDFALSVDDLDAAIKICKYTKYEDRLNKLTQNTIREERKKILHDLFVYLYKYGDFSNAYMFEIVNKIDQNGDMIDYLWDLVIKGIKDRYGKY